MPKKQILIRRSPLARWEVLEQELRQIIEGEYRDGSGELIKAAGAFPTWDVLGKAGRNDLLGGIATHHGGLSKVRRAMGFEPIRKPDGFWKDSENIERELRRVIANEYRDSGGRILKPSGRFPTKKMLCAIGRGDVASAIEKYHRGFPAVRTALGFPMVQRPPGYWADFENVRRELADITQNEYRDERGKPLKPAGRLPTYGVLLSIGQSGLGRAVKAYHGGLEAVERGWVLSARAVCAGTGRISLMLRQSCGKS